MRVYGVSQTAIHNRGHTRQGTVARLISFEGFYRNEYRGLLAVALVLAGDNGAAEDLVQEAFISAHRRWDRVSQYDNPRAWVRRVLINKATSRHRRVTAEIRAVTRLGPPEQAQPDLSPETNGVWSAVHRLPRRQRQAVALHYVGQLSMAEIADVMGCSEGAVKAHLHRAREALRQSLASWDEEDL